MHNYCAFVEIKFEKFMWEALSCRLDFKKQFSWLYYDCFLQTPLLLPLPYWAVLLCVAISCMISRKLSDRNIAIWTRPQWNVCLMHTHTQTHTLKVASQQTIYGDVQSYGNLSNLIPFTTQNNVEKNWLSISNELL
jgi:hypothetical protein